MVETLGRDGAVYPLVSETVNNLELIDIIDDIAVNLTFVALPKAVYRSTKASSIGLPNQAEKREAHGFEIMRIVAQAIKPHHVFSFAVSALVIHLSCQFAVFQKENHDTGKITCVMSYDSFPSSGEKATHSESAEKVLNEGPDIESS